MFHLPLWVHSPSSLFTSVSRGLPHTDFFKGRLTLWLLVRSHQEEAGKRAGGKRFRVFVPLDSLCQGRVVNGYISLPKATHAVEQLCPATSNREPRQQLALQACGE